MRICEIFQSRQGEGRLAGTPSLFVRASGCNLRCGWCDTPYASWTPEGDDLSIDEIVSRVEQHAVRHVVLTGGEPMLFAELVPLTEAFRARDYHITIETAGTLYLPVECDLMSISPKMSNSAPAAETEPKWHHRHEGARHAPWIVGRLMAEYDYQLKFVVQQPDDADQIEGYLAELSKVDRARVLLMPEGTEPAVLAERAQWLIPYCQEHGYTYCPRSHIEWYGPGRGK